jgi:hypothetical protein
MISFYLDDYLEKGMLREVLLREKINNTDWSCELLNLK